jgi:hypothetical protein
MKTLNKIVLFVFTVALLSNCTQHRYGHITGFQLNKHKSDEKVKHSGHYVKRSESKVANFIANLNDSMDQNAKALIDPQFVETSNVTDVASVLENEKIAKISADKVTALPIINTIVKQTTPKQLLKKAKKVADKQTNSLLYWILVIILILLILTLLRTVLGNQLYGLLILVVLIALVGHLLGIW